MIATPDYCVTMARYNAWQNNQLRDFLHELPEKELTRNRKAFFGSIMETASHLLWGDRMWMSRFDGGEAPDVSGADSVRYVRNLGDWDALRFRTDGRIRLWAEGLNNIDLQGDLTWYSGINQSEISKPLGLCVVGFFNHQTHHRGQIHAMLTAAGSKAPVTDLPFMPESF